MTNERVQGVIDLIAGFGCSFSTADLMAHAPDIDKHTIYTVVQVLHCLHLVTRVDDEPPEGNGSGRSKHCYVWVGP